MSATNVVDSHIALMNEIVNTTTNECIVDNSNNVVYTVTTCPGYEGDILIDGTITQSIQVSNKCIFNGTTSNCLQNNIQKLIAQTADAATSGFGGIAWLSGLQASDTRAANYTYLTTELTNSIINAYNNKCFFPSSNNTLINVNRTGGSGDKTACPLVTADGQEAILPGCEVGPDGALLTPDACRDAQARGEAAEQVYVTPRATQGKTTIKPTVEQTINSINECVINTATQSSAYTALSEQVQQESTATKAGLLTPAIVIAIVICLTVGMVFYYQSKKKPAPVVATTGGLGAGIPAAQGGAGISGLFDSAVKAVTSNPEIINKAFKAVSAVPTYNTTTGEESPSAASPPSAEKEVVSPPVVGLSKGAKGGIFAVIVIIVFAVAIAVPLFLANNAQAPPPTLESLDIAPCPPNPAAVPESA